MKLTKLLLSLFAVLTLGIQAQADNYSCKQAQNSFWGTLKPIKLYMKYPYSKSDKKTAKTKYRIWDWWEVDGFARIYLGANSIESSFVVIGRLMDRAINGVRSQCGGANGDYNKSALQNGEAVTNYGGKL